MRIIFISILICALSEITYSQESFFTVTGEVFDAETKEPLGYANVTIIGKAIGTTTNTSGGFEFHIPTAYSKDTLAVSFIGYKTFKMSLTGLRHGRPLKINLEPSSLELGELIVSDKPYTVYSLLDDVISSYEKNYGTKPYEMNGFYREVRQANGSYGYLLEAACRIHKADYKTRYTVALEKVRANASSVTYQVRTHENFLETILMNDYVSNPVMGFFKRYDKKDKYIIEDTTSIDNNLVYVISKGNLPYEKETLHIQAKDLAILRYDVENKYGPDGNDQPKRKIGKNLIARYRYLNMVNLFTKINGIYYPSYIRARFEHDEYDELKKITEKRSVLMRELIINKVNAESPSKITSGDKMKSVKLDDQLQQYDAEFWKTYNILTRTPIQEEILKDLEGKESLEDQFNKQGPKKKN